VSTETNWSERTTRPYRIGYWTHRWWPSRAQVAGLLTGNQPSPRADNGSRRVGRAGYAKDTLRKLTLIRRPHRPWQAESAGTWFARRAFTASKAEGKILADEFHYLCYGQPSPWQRRRLAKKNRRQATS